MKNMYLVVVLLVSLFVYEPVVIAEELDMSLQVGLDDEITTRSQYITFDVFAKINGEKAENKEVSVTNNGKDVPINWSDPAKTSYTVTLEEGTNELVIAMKAGARIVQETSYIEYSPAAIGEVIGEYILSMDAAVGGLGYLIEPKVLPIINGDNAAHHIVRALEEENFTFHNTGYIDNNFYLGTVFGGNLEEKTDYTFPEAIVEAAATNEFELRYDFSPENGLGEFMLSGGSGWMYAVNNVFPNVGFADYYLLDGDVMRVQFTLNLGYDLGGGDPTFAAGHNFFTIVTKDMLTTKVARINNSALYDELQQHDTLFEAYEKAYNMLLHVNPTQLEIDAVEHALSDAYMQTLNELIASGEHKNELQIEVQQLEQKERNKLQQLPSLHEQAQRFEENMKAMPTTVTNEHAALVQQLRQQYEEMSPFVRTFVYDDTITRLQAAEAQLIDETANSKPYTLFPMMTITNRQHPFTITFNDAVHAEQLANHIIVRTSTYKLVPTETIVDGNTVTVRPVRTNYKKGETYTLLITQQLRNAQSMPLSEPVEMTFIVQ